MLQAIGTKNIVFTIDFVWFMRKLDKIYIIFPTPYSTYLSTLETCMLLSQYWLYVWGGDQNLIWQGCHLQYTHKYYTGCPKNCPLMIR